MACREGLALANDLLLRKVRLAGDCTNVIRSCGGAAMGPYGHIIQENKRKRRVSRTSKANYDAHNLARSSVFDPVGRHVWFLNPPAGKRLNEPPDLLHVPDLWCGPRNQSYHRAGCSPSLTQNCRDRSIISSSHHNSLSMSRPEEERNKEKGGPVRVHLLPAAASNDLPLPSRTCRNHLHMIMMETQRWLGWAAGDEEHSLHFHTELQYNVAAPFWSFGRCRTGFGFYSPGWITDLEL
nr:unnamed protein product [Digitaria exilis]